MSTPWFFLSYARVDRDEHLQEFYSDLVKEVRRRAALGDVEQNEIGFLDVSAIKTGADWNTKIATALQTCRVLICLYSPSYFRSEYCAKELQAFLCRVRDYQREIKLEEPPQLIFPVLWLSPGELPKPLPEAVSWIQYTDNDFGDGYTKDGLYFLKNTGKENEYRAFLIKFAQKIVREARSNALPHAPSPASFEQTECPFPDARRSSATSTQREDGRHEEARTISLLGRGSRFRRLAARPALAVPALFIVLMAALLLYNWWARPVIATKGISETFTLNRGDGTGGNDWKTSALWEFQKGHWGLAPSASADTWLVVSGTTPGIVKDKLFDDFEADFTINFSEGTKAGWILRAHRNLLSGGYSGYYFTLSKPAKEGDPFILTTTLRRGWYGEMALGDKPIHIAQYGQAGDNVWVQVRALGDKFDYAFRLQNAKLDEGREVALSACYSISVTDGTLPYGYVGLFTGSDEDKIKFDYFNVKPIKSSTKTNDFLCLDDQAALSAPAPRPQLAMRGGRQ